MSPAKRAAGCGAFTQSVDAFVDGELDPAHGMDMEAHLSVCARCADQVASTRAVRASLQRTAFANKASDTLRVRCCSAILRERLRVAQEPEGDAPPHDGTASRALTFWSRGERGAGLKVALAFAAAAGVAFATGLSHVGKPQTASDARSPMHASAVGLDSLLEDLVAAHTNPPPPQTIDPEELAGFDPLVGVPVRRPAFHPLVSFNGARIQAFRDRRTAVLQYTVAGGRRVSVYVFDPRVLPVAAARRLEPRVVHEHPVYVGRLRGYSVAAAEQRGIGYALASDFAEDESSKLVLAALQQ